MRHRHRQIRHGFTLVEVMIVIVCMAILAGVALPHFTEHAQAARSSAAEFNLHELRSVIELYRQHHDGRLPSASLAELLVQTNSRGVVGTTNAFPLGPYCREIPVNPLTNSAAVRVASSNPPTAASGAADAAWLYDPSSGGLWIDDQNLLGE